MDKTLFRERLRVYRRAGQSREMYENVDLDDPATIQAMFGERSREEIDKIKSAASDDERKAYLALEDAFFDLTGIPISLFLEYMEPLS